jgi:hypothetical protein
MERLIIYFYVLFAETYALLGDQHPEFERLRLNVCVQMIFAT